MSKNTPVNRSAGTSVSKSDVFVSATVSVDPLKLKTTDAARLPLAASKLSGAAWARAVSERARTANSTSRFIEARQVIELSLWQISHQLDRTT